MQIHLRVIAFVYLEREQISSSKSRSQSNRVGSIGAFARKARAAEHRG